MRDFNDDTAAPPVAEEPRGRAALGISPNGMFYDWVLKPMSGRGWTLAAKITRIALAVFTGTVVLTAIFVLTQ